MLELKLYVPIGDDVNDVNGFVEPEIAKMVFDPEGPLPDAEAIYISIDLEPTINAAIVNFKMSRALLHGSLRDGTPDVFEKVEKKSR